MAQDSRWGTAEWGAVNLTSDTSLPSMPWGTSDGLGSGGTTPGDRSSEMVRVSEDAPMIDVGFTRKRWRVR